MTKLSSANELGVDYPIADQSMAGMNVDPVLLTRPVQMSIEDARDVAKATYGVSAAQVRNLGSERDQTLLLQDSTGAALAVMKVSNPAEDPATLDMEALGARHAARADPTLRIALPPAGAGIRPRRRTHGLPGGHST